MTDSMPKNGPYDPATDEQIEFWQVQVDYGAKIVVGPIARDALGGILARLAAAEATNRDVERILRDALERGLDTMSPALRAEVEAFLGRKP